MIRMVRIANESFLLIGRYEVNIELLWDVYKRRVCVLVKTRRGTLR